MKNLIIYHAHCNDGFGAAWAIRDAIRKSGTEHTVELHEAGYGSELPLQLTTPETTVYVVDFSYPPKSMLMLAEHSNELIWIDHHKTAIENWVEQMPVERIPANMKTVLDQTKSGAILAWEHGHKDVAPRILQHIQDRDLWKFVLPGTKEVHLNLSTHPKTMEAWDEIISNCDIFNQYYENFIAEGKAIQRYYDDTITNIISTNKTVCFIDGVKGLACNAPERFASDIGHILATESGTFGLTWETQAGGVEKCSLRSNDDYDVTVLAKTFNGGGHKNAAGFTTKINPDPHYSRIKFLSLP